MTSAREAPVAVGRLTAVLRGQVRTLTDLQGRRVPSAIDKRAVDGPVQVGPTGIEGDAFGNPASHGIRDQAVYAYAGEEARWWESELGTPVRPGLFGENLRTEGIAVSEAVVGEEWRLGPVRLVVTGPRTPCGKFARVMGAADWPRRFRAAHRPGAYLRVAVGGEIAAGATIEVVHRPAHGVTVADLARVHAGAVAASQLPPVTDLAPKWRDLLARRD